ncbi:DUF952 domain-containing protein [Crocosphaera watsonii WH 8501]|uniref:DUF952 domain-containing protein n=3 Tax=Crocosphaera watsonii TaxID=263511 RepID=Q4BWJ8_CROWT|nr:DUF952 domain-containing protein [Crocosphaera watsonii]EAM48276.1 Protein of unknown function DUF952 [Crocosphaera watsonii WH 8501]CCQ51712.1 FIG00572047: hypothetical protein [Crocosphaera watsonii WH 8502]CCQ63840.1 Protein of unknown function DUF952 [Crocosphaera watsonii WH 0401]
MIFHITTPETWETAQLINKYESTSLEKEGFIHCSTKSQVINIANTFYSDYEQLIVLEINPDKLLAEIKWESPVHPNPDLEYNINDTEKLPHVYGVINLDAVEKIIYLCKDNQGLFKTF